MTEQKRITVVIDALGNPKVEAHGFQGVGCAAATAPIEKALAGATATGAERVLKPEWHNVEQAQAEQHQTW